MRNVIKTGDRFRVIIDGYYDGSKGHDVLDVDLVPEFRSTGFQPIINGRQVTVQSLQPDFEVGDIVRHRATGAVRIFEDNGFRVIRSDYMHHGALVEYEPGWDLHNFTAEKWEKVAHIG